jgi:hypothetical protein
MPFGIVAGGGGGRCSVLAFGRGWSRRGSERPGGVERRFGAWGDQALEMQAFSDIEPGGPTADARGACTPRS